MPLATKTLLPLENLLKAAQASSPHEFPSAQTDYFQRYSGVKEWLEINVYPFIGAGLSAEGGIFTSHGADHFDEVIRYAGLLVGAEDTECVPRRLRPYEVYVLLMAILLHDAGNMYGREGHEKRAHELLLDMGQLAGPDAIEKKGISQVAEAHGGKTADGDKDTISQLTVDSHHGPVSFRCRMLASILRFSDEICEHRSRGARVIMDRGRMARQNEIFHLYAESISSVRVDRSGKAVHLEYHLKIEDVIKRWGKNQGEAYLTEEILDRLDKMNLERIYCLRFMHPVALVETIKATIFLVSKDFSNTETFPVTLEDSGYPSCNGRLVDKHPDLRGEYLSQRFGSASPTRLNAEPVSEKEDSSIIERFKGWFK